MELAIRFSFRFFPKDKFPVPVLILVLKMEPGSGPVPGKSRPAANCQLNLQLTFSSFSSRKLFYFGKSQFQLHTLIEPEPVPGPVGIPFLEPGSKTPIWCLLTGTGTRTDGLKF
jgi:hypothetical protein